MPSYVHKSVNKLNESTQIISYLIFTQGQCNPPELIDGKIQKAEVFIPTAELGSLRTGIWTQAYQKQVMGCVIFCLSISVSLQMLTTNIY